MESFEFAFTLQLMIRMEYYLAPLVPF